MRNSLVLQMSTYRNLTRNYHPQISTYYETACFFSASQRERDSGEKHMDKTKIIDKSSISSIKNSRKTFLEP